MDLHKEEEEWLLIRKDGEACPLPRSMIFVGREECDVILLTPSVDKRHAVIFFDSSSKQYHVKDLNSTCGTYLNGVRIPEQSYVKLSHMDNVRFGFGPEMFLVCRSSSSPGRQLPFQRPVPQKCKLDTVDKVTISDEKATSVVSSSEVKQENGSEKSQESLMAVDSLEDVRSNGDDTAELPLDSVVKNNLSTVEESLQTQTITRTVPPVSSVTSNSTKKVSPTEWKSGELEVLYISEERDEAKKPCDTEDKIMTSESTSSGTSAASGEHESPNTVPSEKGNIPSPSTPASMAFTIAFDNNPPVPRKKLGIRDSLSRFAPVKAESERPVQRSRPPKETADRKTVTEKSPGLARKGYSVKDGKGATLGQHGKHDAKEAKEKSVVNGQLSDSANYLIRRMLYNDRSSSADNASRTDSRQSSAKSSAVPASFSATSQTHKTPPDKLAKNKQEMHKAVLSPGEKDALGDDKSETGTYTVDNDQLDPAVEEARKKIDEVFGVLEKVNNCSPHNKGQMLERSNSNPSRMPSHESFWLQSDHESTTSERKEVRHLPPQALRVQGPFMLHETDSDGAIKSDRGLPGSATFTRPKRRLPTPPGEKAPTELSLYNPSANDSKESHLFNAFTVPVAKAKRSAQDSSESHQPFFLGPCSSNSTLQQDSKKDIVTGTTKGVPTALKQRKPDHATSSRTEKVATAPHPPRGLPLFQHRHVDSSNNNVAAPSEKNASDSSGMPPTPGSAKSESNLNLPFKGGSSGATPWRKASWNLSTSDLELNKCETSSVKSENSTSTEPSSQSSHSGKSKGEAPPQMRLNRAFALRRARLGIDAPPTASGKGSGGKEGKQSSSGNTSPYSSNSSLAKTPTSSSPVLTSGSLVRQDGGRFSLRLPRNVSKAPITKNDSSRNSSSKEDLSKLRHKRNDSDPGRSVTRITSFRGTPHSDSEQTPNLMTTSMICTSSAQPTSIQRSASFSSTDGLGLPEEKRTNNNPFKVPRHMLAIKTHSANKSDHKSNAAKERQSNSKTPEAGKSRPVTPNEKSMSISHTDMRNASKSQNQLQSNKKELTALDSLVVSAIYQLSQKLRGSARAVLEKERLKHSQGSDMRLMIDEVLPQMADKRSSLENASEGNLSRDLSNILKNLKKVEQSLEVVFLLMDPENRPPATEQSKDAPQRSNFFIVDV